MVNGLTTDLFHARRWALVACAVALAGLPAAPALAQSTATIAVSAVILSNSNCKFDFKDATLDFGNLDPQNVTDATASAIPTKKTLAFTCKGKDATAVYAFTQDGGQYSTGGANGNRMKHATANEYLPYTLVLTPASGSIPKNGTVDLTITGTVRAADYRGALLGDYADTVVLTVNP
jgi:spore coat protein U-like protein